MPVDNCRHTFRQLTQRVFPRYLADLRERISKPIAMSEFAVPGVGPAALLRRFHLPSDFPGCYVLIEDGSPVYVGISRSVLQRLRQHVRGTTHFDATLAYRMASTLFPPESTRSEAMASSDFRQRFAELRERIRHMDVAFIEIPNPLELHLFEAYCAMELDTSRWNTFETH